MSNQIPSISGELKTWHTVTLEFTSSQTYSEGGSPNPFLDRRLYVDFTGPSTQTYRVHGYFAADGDAASTSADTGDKWHVKFTPDQSGSWDYSASFRSGTDLTVQYPLNEFSGSALDFDGSSGSFVIAASDKTGADFRAKGRLHYNGTRYPTFANGEIFLKVGADSPETALAYSDFDNTSTANTPLKSWSPHSGDWVSGDVEWQGTKGRNLAGAINYLASVGANAFSFLTMNVNGDGKNVWPWAATSHTDLSGSSAPATTNRTQYDVSKLAQWLLIFEHAQKKGVFCHFKTQEQENDQLMDSGDLGTERKLYYRELIARFGHLLALNWNMGEETTQTPLQMIDQLAYVKSLDPYNHLRVLHTFPDQYDQRYLPLTGSFSELTGVSIQNNGFSGNHNLINTWVIKSAAGGKQWVIANDEQSPAETGVAADAGYGDAGTQPDNREDVRKDILWGTFMGGGYGVEYYYGYQTGQTDLDAEDHRSRATKWADGAKALSFFNSYDLNNFTPDDTVVSGSNNWCLKKEGEQYIIYLRDGGSTSLTTTGTGLYYVEWYDPITGGSLQTGDTLSITAGTTAGIGNPPYSSSQDWAAVATLQSSTVTNSIKPGRSRIGSGPNKIKMTAGSAEILKAYLIN